MHDAITQYAKWKSTYTTHSEMSNNYLKELQADLDECEAQHKKIVRKAHAKAGMALGLGFLGVTGQWLGFGTAIYILFDWNTVEPWTWMFRKFQIFSLT